MIKCIIFKKKQLFRFLKKKKKNWKHTLREDDTLNTPLRQQLSLYICLSIESDRNWMACRVTIAHTDSTMSDSSGVVSGIWWQISLSAIIDQKLTILKTSGKCPRQGSSRIFYVSKRVRTLLETCGRALFC